VSHLFQRPLCEMGAAFDFAFRPAVGDPAPEDGGPCDDRPLTIELYSSDADPSTPGAVARTFLVCPEHEAQLRRYDLRLERSGVLPRFRVRPGASGRSERGR